MNMMTVAPTNRFTTGFLEVMDQEALKIEGFISTAYRENDTSSIQEGSEALSLLSSIRSQLSGGAAPAAPVANDEKAPRAPREKRGRRSKASASGKKQRTLSQKEKDRRREVKLAAQRGDFTSPDVLRPYLLCALHNLSAKGGPVKFQDAQRAMPDIMESRNPMTEGDKQFITGSQRPRHMAQTAAMRRKLLLEGVIRTVAGPSGEALDELTDKGFEELKASVAAESIDGARKKGRKKEAVTA